MAAVDRRSFSNAFVSEPLTKRLRYGRSKMSASGCEDRQASMQAWMCATLTLVCQSNRLFQEKRQDAVGLHRHTPLDQVQPSVQIVDICCSQVGLGCMVWRCSMSTQCRICGMLRHVRTGLHRGGRGCITHCRRLQTQHLSVQPFPAQHPWRKDKQDTRQTLAGRLL